jgi:predicted glycosyltransferase
MLKVLLYPGGGTGVGNTVRLLRVALMLRAIRDDVECLEIVANPYARRIWKGQSPKLKYIRELSALTQGSRKNEELLYQSTRRLTAIISEYEPDVFITSRFSGLRGELVQIYPLLKELSCRVVIGWRDVLQADDPVSVVNEYVDQVVVFGTETLKRYLPLHTLPMKLRAGLKFVGYVPPVDRTSIYERAAPPHSRLRILCQVGGGVDGGCVIDLCKSAVGKMISSGVSRRIVLEISRGLLSVSNSSGGSSKLEDYIHSRRWCSLTEALYSSYDLQLSMAGYNTCVEAAYFGVPSIFVPRREDDDDEQLIRARFFCQRFSHMFMCDPHLALKHDNSLVELIEHVLATSPNTIDGYRTSLFARPEDLTPIIGSQN